MPKIKNLATGETFDVTENPVFLGGIWECGNLRFTDPVGDQYAPILDTPPLPLLTPTTFYLALTPQERIAIKASSDQFVKEFWETFQITAVQLGRPVDPNLISVQHAITYLAQQPTDTPPGPGILASKDRIQQILAGIPQ